MSELESRLPLKILHMRLLEMIAEELQIPAPGKGYQPELPANAKEFDLQGMCELAIEYMSKTFKTGRQNTPEKNLKIALAACLTFLRANTITLEVSELEFFQHALEWAHEEMTKEEFCRFLFQHVYCKGLSPKWYLEFQTSNSSFL